VTTETAWSRFAVNRAAILGGAVVVLFVFLGLFGPWLAPYDPLGQELRDNYQSMSAAHWLGTDDLGRDVFSRLLFGARISLSISLVGVSGGLILGVLLGLTAAYAGGWTDAIIMRFVDILYALPGILLAIAIIAVLGKGVVNTIIAVVIYSVPIFARVVRGSVLSVLELEYVEACRAAGASAPRIILSHVMPNASSQLIVQATLMLGTAILMASGLSFLGLGVQPPNPEWGAMLSKGRELMRTTPVVAVAPGLAITLVVLSFSVVGDGLRDALDPKYREGR
jgi:peptide/nickel transport system permease protein